MLLALCIPEQEEGLPAQLHLVFYVLYPKYVGVFSSFSGKPSIMTVAGIWEPLWFPCPTIHREIWDISFKILWPLGEALSNHAGYLCSFFLFNYLIK